MKIKEAEIKKYMVRVSLYRHALTVARDDDDLTNSLFDLTGKDVLIKYPIFEGRILDEILNYATESELSIDDVINALQALHIEVEKGGEKEC